MYAATSSRKLRRAMVQKTLLGTVRALAGALIAFFTAAAIAAGTPARTTSACVTVPAAFRAGRVFVAYPIPSGDTLSLLTDTGGGASIISRSAAQRVGLTTNPVATELAAELGPEVLVAQPPAPGPGSAIPPIPAPLLVMPAVFPVPGWPEIVDGVLGQNWFAARVWTWDYVAGTLSLGCVGHGRPVKLDLPPADALAPMKQFPRITVSIAGDLVPMLLDTGATTWLTDDAATAIGDGGPAVRATSMVTASRIVRWQADHPTWRVIEMAQRGSGARMIEVPEVTIAGIIVGPVWFTERPDSNFTSMMSSMMSGPVEGALGGNAFQTLRMTIDYDQARAFFERGIKDKMPGPNKK